MLSRIPAKTFVEWMAFWELEPFGDQWRQVARVCTVLQHLNAGKGRKMDEDEFIPGQKKKTTRSVEDLGKFLKAMARKAD